MNTDEEWRTIPSHPFYEASSIGRIRSWRDYRGRPTPHLMSQRPQHAAPHYLISTLRRDDGSRVGIPIHRLVIAAFRGPRPDGMVTRHMDGNHLNNHIDNLIYGTQGDNSRDRIRHGTSRWANPIECVNGHLRTPENTRIRDDGGFVCLPCQRASSRASHERRLARTAGSPAVPATHCVHGHEYSPENTLVTDKRRNCRACARRRQLEYVARLRAARELATT